MTPPRRHLPGEVVMMTRRCTDGHFFLRPDPFINDVLAYEFARASQRSGLHVHAAMALSNHTHTVATDPKAQRSLFMQSLMKEVASRRNRDLQRRGPLWQPNHKYNDTVLLDPQAIEDRLLYVWLNPVKDGLVDKVEDWPGFKILPRHWGKPLTIDVPQQTYGRNSPKTITFTPQPPPVPLGMNLEEKRSYYEAKIAAQEQSFRAQRDQEGTRVLGRKAILARDPFAMPKEELPSCPVGPFFATADHDLWKQARDTYRDFLNLYDRARRKLRAGKPVTFPAGTVKLAREGPVRCHPRPDDMPGFFASG